MRILLTGGAGFIGSNFVRYLLAADAQLSLINLDLLTYAGNLENLAGLEDHPRYRFMQGDICDGALVRELMSGCDAVVNMAAESHVDRSIESAAPFVRTNVNGTFTLLEAALELGVDRFVQVSTDEVYGELPWVDPDADPDPDRDPGSEEQAPLFTEETALAPRSPYSACKASADMLAMAYHHTHGMDVVVTRCSNNYGPYQFPEKLIPLMVTNAMEGEALPVYGDGLNIRDWIHVLDHCRGVHAALRDGKAGEVYNLGGNAERTNLQVVRAILAGVGRGEELITFVEDRKGHDRRYAIDASKAKRELGWEPTVTFEDGLASTIEWYADNRRWWERVKSGEYRDYYESMYGQGGRHADGVGDES